MALAKFGDDVNMVVPQGPVRQCVSTLSMANTPLKKSFTINSLLPETALEDLELRRNVSADVDDEIVDEKKDDIDNDGVEESDCDSDLDVIGTTPPLDCSKKASENGEPEKEGMNMLYLLANKALVLVKIK